MEQQSLLSPDLQINPDAAARSAEMQLALDAVRSMRERSKHEPLGTVSANMAELQTSDPYWAIKPRQNKR